MKPTFFAPAPRLSQEVVRAQAALLAEIPLAETILDASPIPAAIINGYRQIVFGNRALAALAGENRSVIGQRLGEILGCTHSHEQPGGCGTTPACRNCGAAWAQLEAIAGRPNTRECRITTQRAGEAKNLELKISATPFVASGERFVILHAQDLSREKSSGTAALND